MLASHSPSPAKPISLEALGVGLYQKTTEPVDEAKPLKIAKAFDSFDATLKLAAMTNQTAEFDKYISDTKKMQAYKGAVSGKLSSQTEPVGARTIPRELPSTSAGTGETPYIAPSLARPSGAASETTTRRFSPAHGTSVNGTVVHLAVVVTLAILAFALAIYLLTR